MKPHLVSSERMLTGGALFFGQFRHWEEINDKTDQETIISQGLDRCHGCFGFRHDGALLFPAQHRQGAGKRRYQGRHPAFAERHHRHHRDVPCTTPSFWRSRRSTPRAASSARRSSRWSRTRSRWCRCSRRKAKKLLLEDKVAAVLGCYTSASRQSVLPVFEQYNGVLLYPTLYEAQECSKNCFYTGAVPEPAARRFRAVDHQRRSAARSST